MSDALNISTPVYLYVDDTFGKPRQVLPPEIENTIAGRVQVLQFANPILQAMHPFDHVSEGPYHFFPYIAYAEDRPRLLIWVREQDAGDEGLLRRVRELLIGLEVALRKEIDVVYGDPFPKWIRVITGPLAQQFVRFPAADSALHVIELASGAREAIAQGHKRGVTLGEYVLNDDGWPEWVDVADMGPR